MQLISERLDLIMHANTSAAEDVDAADEQAEADAAAAEAAAEATVETALEMVDAKKCGLCYGWFEDAEVRWDDDPYCYVCADGAACAARRPGADGRKRARRSGGYEGMARGSA